MKWLWVIILAVLGVLAAIVAFEYLTVSIHSLPAFLGGHTGTGHHPARGHYHTRGAIAGLIAVVLLAIAAFLGYRILQADKAAKAPAATPTPAAEPAGPDPKLDDSASGDEVGPTDK